MSWSCAIFTLRSEKELPDEITRAEREPHHQHDHDQGDREDAQPLAESRHRTASEPAKRSRMTYRDPVTRTPPSGPASSWARWSALEASGTDSTWAKNSLAAA